MNILSIDVGGTKIKIGKIFNNKILDSLVVKTNENPLKQIFDLIDGFIDKKIKFICIAVPALIDLDKGVVFNAVNITSWKKIKLKKILEAKYNVKVLINNDANCFALGEKHFGIGKNYNNFVALTISTGLGAGIIINNKLYEGKNCGAGEFGRIEYKDNKIENYTSGKYFIEKYCQKGEDIKSNKIFLEFGENLGKALALIVNSLDPELIILGGSVMKSFNKFEKSMRISLKKSISEDVFNNLKIKVSNLSDVVLLGASVLVRKKY